MNPRKLLILLLFIALAGFLFFGFYMSPTDLGPFDDLNFDKQVWGQWHQSDNRDNQRGLMYNDLVKNILKPGMTQQNVLDLLGQPDQGKTDNVFNYGLGMWSGYRVDHDTLEIKFDSNGHLTEAYKVQH